MTAVTANHSSDMNRTPISQYLEALTGPGGGGGKGLKSAVNGGNQKAPNAYSPLGAKYVTANHMTRMPASRHLEVLTGSGGSSGKGVKKKHNHRWRPETSQCTLVIGSFPIT